MANEFYSDILLGGTGRVRGLMDPVLPQDALTLAYFQANSGGSGGGAVVNQIEIDVGPVPVREKTIIVANGLVVPTTKILASQSGRAATGRSADENEWTRLHVVASPGTGNFKLWVRCLNGRMTGRFIIDYIRG